MDREFLDFMKLLGTVVSIIGGIVGFVSIVVYAKMQSFQSVKDVKALTEKVGSVETRLNDVISSQVRISGENIRLTQATTDQSRLVGEMMDQVGRYTESSEREFHRIHDRINAIERDGCARARRPGNGHGCLATEGETR